MTCAFALTTSLRGVDAAGLQPVDLLEQHGEVDDDAVADDRRTRRGEDAAREQVQRILLGGLPGPDDDGVTGVVAAVELDDVVDSCRRAGRSPCPCPRRPTGRPPAPPPASAHLLEPVRTASVDGRARSEAIRCAPARPTARGPGPEPWYAASAVSPASGSRASSRPARTASAPSWNRVLAPSSSMRRATRRRTVRRLQPRYRAMASSLKPRLSRSSRCSSSPSSDPRRAGIGDAADHSRSKRSMKARTSIRSRTTTYWDVGSPQTSGPTTAWSP